MLKSQSVRFLHIQHSYAARNQTNDCVSTVRVSVYPERFVPVRPGEGSRSWGTEVTEGGSRHVGLRIALKTSSPLSHISSHT